MASVPGAGLAQAAVHHPARANGYRDPGRRSVEVAFSKVPARESRLRRGALLFDPGGPGNSGIHLMPPVAAELSADVRDRYDLIGLDPRGVAGAGGTPISCKLSARQIDHARLPFPLPGGFDADVRAAKSIADRCLRHAGELLRHITTANTARDMDEIRKALGEKKVAYVGYSYGTYLGGVYDALFPGRTDRIILDSAIDPRWVWRDVPRGMAPGIELKFPYFGRFAAAHNRTYRLGLTPGQVRSRYLALTARLDREPIELRDGRRVIGNDVRRFMRASLHFDPGHTFYPVNGGYEGLASLLRAVQARDAATVASLLPAPSSQAHRESDNNATVATAIWCNDAAWPHSVNFYKMDIRRDSRRYPLAGAMGATFGRVHSGPIRSSRPFSPERKGRATS